MSNFFNGTAFPDVSAWNAFSANELERNSEHLSAEDLAAAWQNPSANAYLYQNGDPVLKTVDGGTTAEFSLDEVANLRADTENGIYLGDRNGAPALAAIISGETELPEPYITLDMRSVVTSGSVAAHQVAALGHGWSMLAWHKNHRFCANCGSKTEKAQAGYRRNCSSCGRVHFPRLDPVSIMLVVDGDRCLMGRQPHFAEGMYSCLAGFIEPGETMENAVRREIKEEAGIDVSAVRYHATQPWPFPHTLMFGCFAKAASTNITMDETELEDCRWFDRNELGDMLTRENTLKTPPPMAIAHQLIKTFYDFSG
ncbi:MAG: NAD(+) diphosphatase [Hyphomicrobiales bacterium]